MCSRAGVPAAIDISLIICGHMPVLLPTFSSLYFATSAAFLGLMSNLPACMTAQQHTTSN